MQRISASRFTRVIGCALVGASLLVAGLLVAGLEAGTASASRPPRVAVVSYEGDRATVRGDRVVVRYESGIGNVLLARHGSWPSTLTIHFRPPFHARHEAFHTTGFSRAELDGPSRPNLGRQIPHRVLRSSERHGVSYALDTRRVTDERIHIGWIDAFRF